MQNPKEKLQAAVRKYQQPRTRKLKQSEHEGIYKLMAVTGYAILLIGDLKNTSIYSQRLKNMANKFLNELEIFEAKIVGINVPDNNIEQSHEQMLDSYEAAENMFNALFTVDEANHEALNSYILKGIDYYKTGGHTLLTTDILEAYGFEKDLLLGSFILKISPIHSLMLTLGRDGYFFPEVLEHKKISNLHDFVSLNKIKHTIELKNIYTVLTGKELKLKTNG